MRLSARAISSERELISLQVEDGLRVLATSPASDIRTGRPPSGRSDGGENRYLWIIDRRGVPYVCEVGIAALEGDQPKHSNLPSDGRAHVGGELWFRDQSCLYVSGGSGRYPPREPAELAAAIDVFRGYDYGVQSLGWDDEPWPRKTDTRMTQIPHLTQILGQRQRAASQPKKALWPPVRCSSVAKTRSHRTRKVVNQRDTDSQPGGMKAYGIEVLEEAVERGSAILRVEPGAAATALKARREALGLPRRRVARATGLDEAIVAKAEAPAQEASIHDMERIAISLGLDERLLSFDVAAGADDQLGFG